MTQASDCGDIHLIEVLQVFMVIHVIDCDDMGI